MRTPSVLVIADIKWPDGVEVPEQVMRDLCPHIAMHIAEFFAEQCDEHPQLLEGAVKVNWGAPTTPELLAEQLQVREEIDRMTTATPDAPEIEVPPEERTPLNPPEVSEEQAKIIEQGPTAEASAPMAERDVPPAKSWAVYQYDAAAVPPSPQCHIYGYDEQGAPLDEQGARDVAAHLSEGHSGTIMALPNENAPAPKPSEDPLEQPHDEVNHDQA